jgi:two-component system, chemotaxis family, sensor kinase CheA
MAGDPYKYFRIEARELLEQLGKGVLALERDGVTPELVARLLRAAHTLKGAARVVRQAAIADRAHALEDALVPLRGAPAPAEPERRELAGRLLAQLDAITTGVAALDLAPEAPPAPAPAPAPAGKPAAAAVTAEEGARLLRADLEDVDALSEGLAEAGTHLGAVRRGVEAVERAQRLVEGLVNGIAARTGAGRDPGSARLVLVVEELRALLAGGERELRGGSEQMERELRLARELADRMRLLPARMMFAALERAARDAGASLGKRVALEASGGQVRLEAEVLGAVQGALVQAVRNAVAHGIEAEGARKLAGKPPVGQVSIAVGRRGNRVSFVCRDDGRGVDLAAVAQAARRQGALPEGGPTPAAEQLLALLLRGGISTAGAVTEVAGRGVGLDVVREVAARLRGEAVLRSQPGRGTELELVVPLSLSALEVLVVEAGGQVAGIPLDVVRRAVRLPAGEINRTGTGESLVLDGQAIPFLPLAPVLTATAPRAAQAAREPTSWSAVVVADGNTGQLAALGVDRLLGTEHVVSRPLPAGVPLDPAVAGASLDAAGNPRLVLDAAGLVARAVRGEVVTRPAPVRRPPILVVDDSLTTRMLEQSILESAGYEVDLAASGEEGLEKALARRYGLFLVDVEMPGIDGFTFIERSRADRRLADVPAILVTSRNDPEDFRRGETVGAHAYVVKSQFNQGELLERIRGLVG